jgi:DICT domain-containing protein
VSDKIRLLNGAFMVRVREYLTREAVAGQVGADNAGNAWDSGLADNVFYEFDADSMIAIWHAIEDIALEEASGSLVAAIQEYSWVESQRERYEQLALTLDNVEIIGSGPAAAGRRIPRAKLVADKKGAAKRFRAVLYEGRRVQVGFVAEQENDAKDFEARRFTGFYTFDPGLITRLRADLRSGSFREFARQRAIYDAERQIQRELALQKDALAKAARRLRLDSERYRPRQFVSDFEKGLNRLVQWKNKVPKLIEQVEGN